jgi:hypothetical protein
MKGSKGSIDKQKDSTSRAIQLHLSPAKKETSLKKIEIS